MAFTAVMGALSCSVSIVFYLIMGMSFTTSVPKANGEVKDTTMRTKIMCAISIVLHLVAIIVVLQTVGLANRFPFLPADKAALYTNVACLAMACYLLINSLSCLFARSMFKRFVIGISSIMSTIFFFVTALCVRW